MLAAHKAFWVSRAIQVSIALVGAGMRILKRMPTMRKLVEQYDADQMGALLRPPARSRSCLPALPTNIIYAGPPPQGRRCAAKYRLRGKF